MAFRFCRAGSLSAQASRPVCTWATNVSRSLFLTPAAGQLATQQSLGSSTGHALVRTEFVAMSFIAAAERELVRLYSNAEDLTNRGKMTADALKDKAKSAVEAGKDAAHAAKEKVKDAAHAVKEKAQDAANAAKDASHDAKNAAKDKAHDVKNAAKDKGHDAAAKDSSHDAKGQGSGGAAGKDRQNGGKGDGQVAHDKARGAADRHGNEGVQAGLDHAADAKARYRGNLSDAEDPNAPEVEKAKGHISGNEHGQCVTGMARDYVREEVSAGQVKKD